MHKVGMTLPNDGSRIDDVLADKYGNYLIIHDGLESLAYVRDIRRSQGFDPLIIIRFNFQISDPTSDIVSQIRDWYPIYKAQNGGNSQAMVFMWENEPDGAEGGHSPEYIRDRLWDVNPKIRQACPGIGLAGPNFASENTYQKLDEWRKINGMWRNLGLRGALTSFDLLLGHWYVDSTGVDRLGNVFENPHMQDPDGGYHSNPLFGRLWGLSEYSSVGLNSPKPSLGVEADTYDAARRAYEWRHCLCVVWFIARWGNPQPGGIPEQIYPNPTHGWPGDPQTRAGLRRALNQFPVIATPSFPLPLGPIDPVQPPPVDPPTPPTPPTPPAPPAPEEPKMQPMRKRMMLWNHAAGYLGERTVADWVRTLRIGGIDSFSPKAWQRNYFMSAVGSHRHPLTPSSLYHLSELYEAFMTEGILYIPWGVPEGRSWRAEAEFAVQIAEACGGNVEIDLEPYQGFWEGPYKDITPYFAYLKERGVPHVICNFDARGNLWRPMPLESIAPYVDHWCTQSYDVGFGVPFRPLYDHAIHVMRTVGQAKSMGIVADVRAGLGVADRAAYAQQKGCNEMAAWAADMAPPAAYHGFARFPTRPYWELIKEPNVPNQNVTERVLQRLSEMYRINHQIFPSLIPAQLNGEWQAAQKTWDEQLNLLKADLRDVGVNI